MFQNRLRGSTSDVSQMEPTLGKPSVVVHTKRAERQPRQPKDPTSAGLTCWSLFCYGIPPRARKWLVGYVLLSRDRCGGGDDEQVQAGHPVPRQEQEVDC